MREIKFRAWIGEEMVKDPIIYGVNGDQMAVGSRLNEGLDNFFIDGEGKYHLMQFTGLKDKNGKEIYEGDICKIRTTEDFNCIDMVGEVRWLEKHWCFRIVVADHDGWSPNEFVKWVKIIGNIHENPELISK